jgi:predicted nucleotide-binding protein
MNALNPSLFIGSSSEGLPVARALQAELDEVCEPLVWSQGVFGIAETTIGALLQKAQDSDFAALILTPDDSATTRGTKAAAARE